mmetsp:Transcript_59369/g.158972  ORF Transcript_59369/g.158972 Transcript_59369/m.158972 type:complete len:141 (+) Transcript_59369:167-589(+)
MPHHLAVTQVPSGNLCGFGPPDFAALAALKPQLAMLFQRHPRLIRISGAAAAQSSALLLSTSDEPLQLSAESSLPGSDTRRLGQEREERAGGCNHWGVAKPRSAAERRPWDARIVRGTAVEELDMPSCSLGMSEGTSEKM